MDFMLSSSSSGKYPIAEAYQASSSGGASSSFEFDFSASKASTNGSGSGESMSSTDEVLSPTDEQSLVGSFLDIAIGQTSGTARQFLQSAAEDDEELPASDGAVSRGRNIKIRDLIPPPEDQIYVPDVDDFEVNTGM